MRRSGPASRPHSRDDESKERRKFLGPEQTSALWDLMKNA